MASVARWASCHAFDPFQPIRAVALPTAGLRPRESPVNATDEAPHVLVTRLPMSDALGVVRAYEVVAEPPEETEGEGESETEKAVLRTLHAIVNVVGVDTLAGDHGMLFVRVTPGS